MFTGSGGVHGQPLAPDGDDAVQRPDDSDALQISDDNDAESPAGSQALKRESIPTWVTDILSNQLGVPKEEKPAAEGPDRAGNPDTTRDTGGASASRLRLQTVMAGMLVRVLIWRTRQLRSQIESSHAISNFLSTWTRSLVEQAEWSLDTMLNAMPGETEGEKIEAVLDHLGNDQACSDYEQLFLRGSVLSDTLGAMMRMMEATEARVRQANARLGG
ncbi:hypothetical protein F5Y14DRAFT_415588 [Nemania sp. NC0429]|nr:hypothetical protein F5Y14DRAFT_415588 [Nemania sp. NC0429]